MTRLHAWAAEIPIGYHLIYVGADAGANPDAPPGPPGTELAWGDEQTLILRANSDNATVTVEYHDSEPEPGPDAHVAYTGQMGLSGWLPVSSPTMANEQVDWQMPPGPSSVRVEVNDEHWRIVFWPGAPIPGAS
jgi:hypothetical protein